MPTTRTGHHEQREVGDRRREFTDVRHPFPATGSGFLVAPVLWFGYFVAAYSLQGAGCALGLDQASLFGVPALRLILLAVTAAVVAALLLFGAWSFRSWQRLRDELDQEQQQSHQPSVFLACGALLHAGLFLVAVLWTGVPILLLDSCEVFGAS